MNEEFFTELWQAHKQRIIALALLLLANVYAFNTMLPPMRRRLQETQSSVTALNDRIKGAQDFMAVAALEDPRRVPLQESITAIKNGFLAPCESSAPWIAEQTYNVALPPGLQLGALTEIDGWSPAWSHAANSNRLLRYTGVRMEMETDNATLNRFIRALEIANPYMSVNQITILSRPRTPGTNFVNLVVEWPQWCP